LLSPLWSWVNTPSWKQEKTSFAWNPKTPSCTHPNPKLQICYICSFHYHAMEMVWCLMLSIFLLIKRLISHLLNNHEFLHSWSFSSSHMICSFCILTFLIMIVWTCVNEIKCNNCPFLHISYKIFFDHRFLPPWLMMCSFSFPLDLTCFITWFEVLIKWFFGFPCIFMNKLKGEFKKRSHMLVVDFNSFLAIRELYSYRFFSMKVEHC